MENLVARPMSLFMPVQGKQILLMSNFYAKDDTKVQQMTSEHKICDLCDAVIIFILKLISTLV